MAYLALVVSREKIDLDSRFTWTSKLSNYDVGNVPCIIFHDSADDDTTVLFTLAQIFKLYPTKKFMYINSEINPLLSTFFWGMNGAVFNQEIALSDASLLLSLMEEYNASDFRVKPAEDEFTELKQAMNRLITGTLDEEEVHAIITSPDWLAQVSSSMEAVSSSLVAVTQNNTALVEHVTKAREILQSVKDEHMKVKDELAEAMKAVAKIEVAGHDQNVVLSYPQLRIQQSVKNVLYIRELSHCMFLTSFFLAYMRWLSTQYGVKSRILIVEPRTPKLPEHYKDELFYLLTKDSIAHSTKKTAFVTSDPKKNIIDYFFSEADIPLYIVLDRFQGDMLLSGAKMKLLYASGRSAPLLENGVNPAKVFRCYGGSPESYVIPFIPQYSTFTTDAHRINAYHKACKELFVKLDTFLGISE